MNSQLSFDHCIYLVQVSDSNIYTSFDLLNVCINILPKLLQINCLKMFLNSIDDRYYEYKLMQDMNIRYRDDKGEVQSTGFIRSLLKSGITIMKSQFGKLHTINNSLSHDNKTASNIQLSGRSNGTGNVGEQHTNHLRYLETQECRNENEDNEEVNQQPSQSSLKIQHSQTNQFSIDANTHNHYDSHENNKNEEDNEGVIELSQCIADFCSRSNMYVITPTAKHKFLQQIQYLSETIQNLEECE